MKGWQEAIILIAVGTGAGFLTYWKGHEAGREKATLHYEQQLRKAEAATRAKSEKIEAMATEAMIADQSRETNHREIIRETSKIIDRPVYLDQCIDGDGLLILDRIAANANGDNPAASVGAAPAPAKGSAHE